MAVRQQLGMLCASVVLALSCAIAAQAMTTPPSGNRIKGVGVLEGKTLMAREISAEARHYWQNYELTKAVATALAESAGTLGAYHDNLSVLASTSVNQIVANPETYQKMTVLNPATGRVRLDDGTIENHPPESQVVTSRDCGLYQINIPASEIGTSIEFALRTESKTLSDYAPVMVANVNHAWRLYSQPWVGRAQRLWQPWVAYTTGWATFPEWWVWHQDASGTPVGPWIPTGRYLQRAIAGQMNMHVVIFKDWKPADALHYGQRYAAHFGVKDTLYINTEGILTWHIPSKPALPPADGVGPRPQPNDGT